MAAAGTLATDGCDGPLKICLETCDAVWKGAATATSSAVGGNLEEEAATTVKTLGGNLEEEAATTVKRPKRFPATSARESDAGFTWYGAIEES